MPFPLHKTPRGLLELLRLRTLGSNPPGFGEVVTPTVDVSEFYGADTKVATSSATSTGALAALDAVLNPAGQVRLHAISARLAVGAAAATNITLQVGLRAALGGERVGLGSLFIPALAIGGVVNFGVPTPPWIFPPSGSSPGVFGLGGQWSFFAFAAGTAAGVDHTLICRVMVDDLTGAQ